MATKSILKEICVEDKSLCRRLAAALESSKGKKHKKVWLSGTCQIIPQNKVEEFFVDK